MSSGLGLTTAQIVAGQTDVGVAPAPSPLLQAKQAQIRSQVMPTPTPVMPAAAPGGIVLTEPAPVNPVSQGTTPLPASYPSAPTTLPAPDAGAAVPVAAAAQMMAQPVTLPGAALPSGDTTPAVTVTGTPVAAGFDPTMILYLVAGALVLSYLSRPKRRP